MPDEEKPAPEGVSSDQDAASEEAKKPAESRAAAGADKPAAAKAAEKPAASSEAAKPAEKPAAKKAPPGMATTPWEGPLVDRLRERFGDEITEFSTYQGDQFLVAKLPAAFAVLQYLKADEGFDYLVDVTAVHYPEKGKPFEVIWILYSHPHNVRIRVKTEVAEGESPRSADSLYASANWLEREVYDMFGIAFAEHPNMTRILLPDEWQGYPLRKDYSIIGQDEDWVRENLNIESGQ
jgi:NADH-quinone oxidoreductase subunit C